MQEENNLREWVIYIVKSFNNKDGSRLKLMGPNGQKIEYAL